MSQSPQSRTVMMGQLKSFIWEKRGPWIWLRFIAVFLLAIFGPVAAHAHEGHVGQQWTKYSSLHFDLYAPRTGAEYASQTLIDLEQERAFFDKSAFRSSFPRVTLIAFGSQADYAAYRINAGAYASYQHSSQGDFILLQELDGRHKPAALHEYVHFVLHHAGYQLPLWLNEGLADVYSTMEPDGGGALIGRASRERMAVIDGGKRLSIQSILQVDHRSPYYTDPAKMELFYARSWALVHMLSLDPRYSSQFESFLQAISDGTPSDVCFSQIYGKSIAQIQSDLDDYLSSGSLPAARYAVNLENVSRDIKCSSLPEEQLDAALAMVLASNPFAPGAERRIEEFANAYPDSPVFEECLGYVALRMGRSQDALTHFSRAVERGSTDATATYYCARLQKDSGVPDEKIIPLLERVLALQPSDDNARIDLGFTAANANHFELALSALSSLRYIQPNMAYDVYYAMAYCQAKLNRLGEARRFGFQAKQVAKSVDQQNRADNLLKFVDESEGTTELREPSSN